MIELGGIKQGWKEQTLGDSPVLVDIIASVVAARNLRQRLGCLGVSRVHLPVSSPGTLASFSVVLKASHP